MKNEITFEDGTIIRGDGMGSSNRDLAFATNDALNDCTCVWENGKNTASMVVIEYNKILHTNLVIYRATDGCEHYVLGAYESIADAIEEAVDGSKGLPVYKNSWDSTGNVETLTPIRK